MEKHLGFEALSKMETIGDIQKLEMDFDKLPEIGFKMTYKKKDENFAEKLIDEILNGNKNGN